VTSFNLMKAGDCLSIEKSAHVHPVFLVSLWPAMELNTLISAADIESALQNYMCTADSKSSPTNINFTVSRATEKVQGFLSIILRAKVTYRGDDGKENLVNFIVKRPPVSELQLQYTRGSDFSERESDFFNNAQPLLLENLRYSFFIEILQG
jgi:Ecdysteroid kinase-like family